MLLIETLRIATAVDMQSACRK